MWRFHGKHNHPLHLSLLFSLFTRRFNYLYSTSSFLRLFSLHAESNPSMATRPRQWLLLTAQIVSLSSVSAYESVSESQAASRSVATGSYHYTSEVDSAKYHKIVIAHAVLACSAWALFAPLGAIFLRSGARGINLLKLHALWQLFVYAM
jgi:hypothetical protein